MTSRVAVAILVLLLLPVVVGPIVIGVLLERGIEKVFDSADPSRVGMEFERGLYTSRAVTRIGLHESAASGRGEGRSGQLVAEHVIVHGPIPLAAPAIGRSPFDLAIVLVDSRIEADPETMPGIAAALEGDALASVFTRVTSVGDVDADITAPPFELDGGRLIWAGLEGTLRLRESGRRLAGEFATDGLRLADDDISLTVEPGTTAFEADLEAGRLHATLEQSGTDWRVGDRHYGSGAIRIEAEQPMGSDALGESSSVWTIAELSGEGGLGVADFEVSGVKIEQSVARDAATGLHRAELALAFDAWRVGDALPDGPGGFRAMLERIDRTAVERFRGALQELERSGSSPEQIEAMRPFVVMEHVPDLLASSPAFDVRDGFMVGPEGRLAAELHLTVDGSQPELLADPFMLMGLIEARASLGGPEPLVRRLFDRLLPAVETAPPVVAAAPGGVIVSDPTPDTAAAPAADAAPVDRVDAWLEDGTLVRAGDRVRFEARFENGIPLLNGEPVDPAVMTNLMPGM